MRLTHTIWIRGKDPVDIMLISTADNNGHINYIIKDQQSGDKGRMISRNDSVRLQAFLERLTIPVVPPPDRKGGNTFMLQLESGFNSVTYYWSSKLPEGWERLKELSDILVDINEVSDVHEHDKNNVKSMREAMEKISDY